MPSVAAYRKGFGLKKNMRLMSKTGPTFILKRCDVDHIVMEPYVRYEFPTVMALAIDPVLNADRLSNISADVTTVQRTSSTVASKDMVKEALAVVQAQVDGAKIIPSDYGNPYECHFGTLDAKSIKEKGVDLVEITARGWGDRRTDIDGEGKAAPQKVEKTIEEKRAQREETKRIKEALPGYRLITATYSNSKCTTCGEIMESGVRIAKLEDSTEKGGWSHVDCLLSKKGVKIAKVSVAAAGDGEKKAATKKRKRGEDKEAEADGEDEKAAPKAKKAAPKKPAAAKAAEGKGKKPAKKKAKKE